MLYGWSMTETNDGAGGRWLLLSSLGPNAAIPFASFGKLVTFTFADVINPSNAFSSFEIDNTLYTNPGGQSFLISDTNSFLTSFPPLPHGTPVPWLISYGYSGDFTNAEFLDPDNDGVPNWQEYRANTNPTNAASVFLGGDLSRQSDGRFVVTFRTSTNRSYQVQASRNLVDWEIVQDKITGLGQDVTIIDTRFLPNVTKIFYRMLVY
jgi:hypothetical protein